MIRSSEEIIRRARSLVGARFRPQGRNPQTGLDCVGVILWSFGLEEEGVRKDYRLRGRHLPEMEAELAKRFRRIAVRHSARGDILLCAPSANQAHLVVNCGDSFVHAHLGLKRVVETPGRPEWTILAAFRRRRPRKRSV